MNTETALEPISLARQALAEATTLPDMKSVRSWAEALRAYAKSRGMGIEAENQAAEVVIRAERKMGVELRRMAEAGERNAGENSQFAGSLPGGERLRKSPNPTLGALGLDRYQSSDWQKLATIPDESFDAVVADAYANGERLSRMDFLRAYFGPNGKREPLRDDEDDWTKAWAKARDGVSHLGTALDRGWPLQSDRTRRGWAEVDVEITAWVSSVERDVGLFQQRVRAFMAALGVCSTADTPGVAHDD